MKRAMLCAILVLTCSMKTYTQNLPNHRADSIDNTFSEAEQILEMEEELKKITQQKTSDKKNVDIISALNKKQQSELAKAKFIRNIILVVSLMLLFAVLYLYSKLKKEKKKEIELKKSNQELQKEMRKNSGAK